MDDGIRSLPCGCQYHERTWLMWSWCPRHLEKAADDYSKRKDKERRVATLPAMVEAAEAAGDQT